MIFTLNETFLEVKTMPLSLPKVIAANPMRLFNWYIHTRIYLYIEGLGSGRMLQVWLLLVGQRAVRHEWGVLNR